MLNILMKILLIPFILFSFAYNISAQKRTNQHLSGSAAESYPPLKYSISVYQAGPGLMKDSSGINDNDSLGINNITNDKISLTKLGVVCGASLTILGGIYYRWKTAWWNDGNTGFHIYYNYTYIDNVDKVGHVYGGILFAECFGAGLRWAGLNKESSLLYGGIFSSLVYTGVELKDGYAPNWGFDPADLGASVLGAFYPYAQQKIPFLQNFNLKWSYFPSNSAYYKDMNEKSRNNQFFNDDYEGQTFWLAANIKNLLPKKIDSFMPDFLNLALGVSVENLDNPLNKHKVFILSPDIDLVKLFKPDNSLLKEVLQLLNYIHIPLPAIRISPDFKAYPIYLKP